MKQLEKIGSKDLEKEKLISHYGNLSQLVWTEQHAFNRQNVENFFHNLRKVYTRGNNICPQNIFNLDETAVSTVPKPRQVFAQAGTKQVERITSGERGENVTMCACANATGNALPPAFVFPRPSQQRYAEPMRAFYKKPILVACTWDLTLSVITQHS